MNNCKRLSEVVACEPVAPVSMCETIIASKIVNIDSIPINKCRMPSCYTRERKFLNAYTVLTGEPCNLPLC